MTEKEELKEARAQLREMAVTVRDTAMEVWREESYCRYCDARAPGLYEELADDDHADYCARTVAVKILKSLDRIESEEEE